MKKANARNMPAPTCHGRSYPLGATVTASGVNFCLYSRHATGMELLLFEAPHDPTPARVIPLSRTTQKTYHYWHVEVAGLKSGQTYAWRADGPRHLRFDPQKVLLDPYGRAVVTPPGYDRQAATESGDNAATAMRSVVVDRRCDYDWEGDKPLRHPASKTVIYEMHVAGFTRHPSSGVAPSKAGTYLGLIEKIDHLKHLGVTAVELLPVFHFDVFAAPTGVINYWGYQPLSFFIPHPGYCTSLDPLEQLREFKDMVKALHRAGIEVILDVVYNHTAEGGNDGPTLCWKGLDSPTYYLKDPNDPSRLADYSGCGNSLNGYHSVVRRLILDSLRYWVQDMHIDGFRFDLASVLSRDSQGRTLKNPPILWDIESDPVLAGSKLIAEAWDASGLYQVGSFVGDSWMEWNGKFRDDVRGFFRGENGLVRTLADRLLGSPDVFGHENREAEQSINFVTCHDGFTLNDLVSYDGKHNDANLEDNRDGSNDNRSWNCGQEGPTSDPGIESLRNRQVKNFLAINLLAVGTPMILMGDEMRRSQGGNNNAYCHDNPTSWMDWSLLERHRDIFRFAQTLIQHTTQRNTEFRQDWSLNQLLNESKVTWHGTDLNQPDWRDLSHSLAFTVETPGQTQVLHGILNAFWEPLEFQLPPGPWLRWIDTSLASPEDIRAWGEGPEVRDRYLVQSRTVAFFTPA